MDKVFKVVFKVMLLVFPVGVIGFCCWFFWYAFERTMKQIDNSTPPVQIQSVSAGDSNVVWKVVDKRIITELIKEPLLERAKIAKDEHDRFRAELATWLSVFGLLSILATLVMPICAYLVQLKEVEKLQGMLSEQKDATDKIKDEMQKIMKSRESVEESKNAVSNSTEAITEVISDIANSTENRKMLGVLLFKFKTLWGKDCFEDKISAGLDLFKACNDQITKALRDNDVESLVRCVNVLNSACAYLGSRNLQEFKTGFCNRLGKEKPLTNSNEAVHDLLSAESSGPQLGFYRAALKLQDPSA